MVNYPLKRIKNRIYKWSLFKTIYLFEKQRKTFYPFVHSLELCHILRLKTRTQALGPSSTAFPDMLAGNWIRSSIDGTWTRIPVWYSRATDGGFNLLWRTPAPKPVFLYAPRICCCIRSSFLCADSHFHLLSVSSARMTSVNICSAGLLAMVLSAFVCLKQDCLHLERHF